MNERELTLTTLRRCGRADLYAKDLNLTDKEIQKIEDVERRRKNGEPIQYILENCNFLGHEILVNPSVLIPRPETEILVEKIIERFEGKKNVPLRILDLGTGSGNIAIALAKYFPLSSITALDISASAIEVASYNARVNGVSSQIQFINTDMRQYLGKNNKGEFDLVVSNPPYIPSDEIQRLQIEIQYEPRVALDGGLDGLNFYRLILSRSQDFLKRNGSLFCEIGDGQSLDIEIILKSNSAFGHLKFYRDYRNTNRIFSVEYKPEKLNSRSETIHKSQNSNV